MPSRTFTIDALAPRESHDDFERRDHPCVDVFHIEDGKVSAFDCHYLGTIMLGQLGVLGNLEAAIRK